MKKFVTALVLAVVLMLCAFTVVGCGNKNGNGGESGGGGNGEQNNPPTVETFAAPTGVELDGDTLVWNAVAGATSGYTVRVGGDNNKTVSVNATGVELLSGDIFAFIVEGDNVLAVKVNAVGDKKESAYSASVTYTYDAGAFSAPTDLQVANGVLTFTAVDGAEIYIITNGDNTLEVSETTVDFTDDRVKAALGLSDGETYAELTLKVKATEDKKESHAALIHSFKMPGYTADEHAAAASFKSEVTDMNLPSDWSEVQADDAEDYIVAITAKLNKLNGFDENMKAHEDIVSAGETLNNALSGAKEVVKEAVDALVDEAETLISKYSEDGYMPVKQDADNVVALENKVKDLGAYGKTLWDNDKVNTVERARAVLSAISVKTEKTSSAVFMNVEHGGTCEFYVMREHVNIFGTAVEWEEYPEIAAGDNVTETSVTENNGWLVYRIKFTAPTADRDEADPAIVTGTHPVTVSYTIEGEDEVTVIVDYPDSIVYSGGDDLSFMVNGVFTAYGVVADRPLYMDVYADSALSFDGRDADVTVLSAPLVREVPIANGYTEDTIKSLIARGGVLGENLQLRLVVYTLTEAGGVKTYSIINSSSVSEKLVYTITEEDVKLRLDFTDVALDFSDAAGIVFGGGGLTADFLNGLASQFNDAINKNLTSSDLNDYIVYYLDVTYNGVTKRVCLELNLNVGADGGGYSSVALKPIMAEIYKLFGEVNSGSFTVRLGFTLSEKAIDEGYGEYLRDSLNKEYAKTYTLGNVKLENTWALDYQDGSNADCIGYKWEVINNNKPYCDSVEILIYRARDGVTDYTNETPLTKYVYSGLNDEGDYAVGFIQWANIEAELIKAWGALVDKQNTEHFVFAIRALVNEDGVLSGFIDSDLVFMKKDNELYVKEYVKDWSIPTDVQLFFREQGSGVVCVAQIKPNSGSKLTTNGEVFTSGGTDYVQVKLSKDGSDDIMLYLACEDGQLKLYKSKEDMENKSNAASCAAATDGWINVDTVNEWMGGGFDLKEWEIRTKVVKNNSGFYTDYPDGSDGWSNPETWDNRDGI